ncbi:GCN5 family acetyltransferase [Gordoniibacillus kamchatkensis]|uniref:GCN5 family acetyltransferase n=1 Tax=Gordoniibacillus kamchatkensis TaxID=1590651 RepID=A0ABR5ACQ3_9BACL|nr:GNAT family N-acetyltransferase [Paenibacillus sp. VKM B-2647]KIL38751.1 GCN5 family acetyltransferase [Paenibacillus sp. VKM B-2647]
MSTPINPLQVRLEPWSEADLGLLRLLNSPEMTEHLGGPETEEQIKARHKRYLETGAMLAIVIGPNRDTAGSIGYWSKVWQGEDVYEIGWGILPPYQGRGLATQAATAAIALARAERKHRYIHAFPSVDNPASNAVCRKLGFALAGECDFEYPPGSTMRCNDWKLDLEALSSPG